MNNDYLNSVESMHPILLQYDNVVIRAPDFNSEYISRFTIAKKTLYFGELDKSKKPIVINIPKKAILNIYPNDDESVLLEYIPRCGLKRKYKLSNYGDFKRHLEILYEITGDEIFNPK